MAANEKDKEKEKLRLDKYLWCIRLFKTRSESTDACAKGKVKYNGDSAKPSKTVSVGDEYEVKTEHKRWVIKVTGLLEPGRHAAEAPRPGRKVRPDLRLTLTHAQSHSIT